jgi:hypothetical protein
MPYRVFVGGTPSTTALDPISAYDVLPWSGSAKLQIPVASVTGNVGGNVTGSVGSVAGNVTGSVGSVSGNVAGSIGSIANQSTLIAAIEAAFVDAGDATDFMAALLTKINSLSTSDLATVTIATAARDAILDRVLPGNHDGAFTLGNLIQGANNSAFLANESLDLIIGEGFDASTDTLVKLRDAINSRMAATAYAAAPTASENADAVAAQASIVEALTTIETNLDAKVSEAGSSGGTVIPVNQVPVPASRTWILKLVGSELQGEVPLVRQHGESNVFAVDYRNDLSANGRIVSLDDVTILSGPADGITITSTGDDGGVDRSQAKFRIAIATAGVYVIQVTSTYSDHDGSGEAIGIVTLIVT